MFVEAVGTEHVRPRLVGQKDEHKVGVYEHKKEDNFISCTVWKFYDRGLTVMQNE